MSASSEKQVENLIVVYHANCIDGAASAWAVMLAHKKSEQDVTFIPYEHFSHDAGRREILAALSPDARLYFVDVAPDKTFLDELMQKPLAGVTILDHHKTAFTALDGYTKPPSSTAVLEISIDPARPSCALMVWEKLLPHEKAPAVLKLIDRMDGDAAGLTSPKDFAAAAYVDAHDISTPQEAFKSLRGMASLGFNAIAERGEKIVEDQAQRLKLLLEQASVGRLPVGPNGETENVLIINANVQHFGRRVTEQVVTAAKGKGCALALVWFVQKNGKVTASLRSNGVPDLSTLIPRLATRLGCTGGGHATAGALHFDSLFAFAQAISAGPQSPSSPPPAPPFQGIH